MANNNEVRISWKQRILLALLAIFMSYIVRDAIIAFADVFLPIGELQIKVLEPIDNKGGYVRIVQESNPRELFIPLRDELLKDGNNTGWEYVQGQARNPWTHISSATPGATITIKVRKDPQYYFTVLQSRWNSALEYTVQGDKPHQVNCYLEDSDGELLRITPFKDGKLLNYLREIFHALAAISFYILFQSSLIWLKRNEQESP